VQTDCSRGQYSADASFKHTQDSSHYARTSTDVDYQAPLDKQSTVAYSDELVTGAYLVTMGWTGSQPQADSTDRPRPGTIKSLA